MILVILGIFIGLLILGVVLDDGWGSGAPLIATGVIVGICAFIAAIILTACVSGLTVIDEKIEMYETENQQIEEQIADMVAQYQEYETDIFTDVDPEDAMVVIARYPELKSDTLVQKQMDVYISNKETIKSLKAQKISGKVMRWWLYFGG